MIYKTISLLCCYYSPTDRNKCGAVHNNYQNNSGNKHILVKGFCLIIDADAMLLTSLDTILEC